MMARVAARLRLAMTAVPLMRLVALLVVAALAGLPLAVLPSPVFAWLAVPGVAVGTAGVIVLSVPLVTVSASLAMIEYTLAVVVAGAPVDVVTATGFGAALFVLLEVVHLAGRMHGAAVGRTVIATQARHWLLIIVIAGTAAIALSVGASALRLVVAGTSLPFAVIASAAGALLAAAGVLARVTAAERGDEPPTSSSLR